MRVQPLSKNNIILKFPISHLLNRNSHSNLHTFQRALQNLQILRTVQWQLRNEIHPTHIDATWMYSLEYLAICYAVG